jgi:hypothetical protein
MNATFTGYYEAGANVPLAVMDLLAKLAAANPPFNKTNTAHVNHELRAAGVGHGTYKPATSVNLSLAYLEVVASLEPYAATSLANLGNGWDHNVPQGIYGSGHVKRALIADIGYLELTADQVIYSRQSTPEFTSQSNEPYLYIFSSKPPIESWSVVLLRGIFVNLAPFTRF